MVKENLFKFMMRVDGDVAKATTKKAKAEALQKHSGATLKMVLGLTFDPRIQWNLPEGTPPFKTEGNGIDSEPILEQVLRHGKLKIYLKGNGYDKASRPKIESMFMGILGEMHPEDALMLCAIKDKKPPFKAITLAVIKEAFPNLAKDW